VPNAVCSLETGNCEPLATTTTTTSTTTTTLPDSDHDGVIDGEDNCVDLYNPSQGDRDVDGIGDACDPKPFDCQMEVDAAGYPVLLGEDISSQECSDLIGRYASEGEVCFTTCIQGIYLTRTAGEITQTCCGGVIVEKFPCTDCPGQNPVCPDPAEVCGTTQTSPDQFFKPIAYTWSPLLKYLNIFFRL
jgi:hypothetical protein